MRQTALAAAFGAALWSAMSPIGVSGAGDQLRSPVNAAEVLGIQMAADRLILRLTYPEAFGTQEDRTAAMADQQVLIVGSQSSNATLRAAAVRAIGRLERPGDVRALSLFLMDSSRLVRLEAANAIGQALFQPGKATDLEAQAMAALLLRGRAFGEPDSEVAGAMYETLGAIRDTKAAIDIERALVGGTFVVRPRPANFELRQDGALRGLALMMKSSTGRGFEAATIQRLRRLAAPGFGLEDDVGPRLPALDALVAAHDEDQTTIMMAASFRCAQARRTGLLTTALRPDCGWEIRRAALQMIRTMRPGLQSVVQQARRDPSFRVRMAALAVLQQSAAPSCGPALSALNDPSPFVVMDALRLLTADCTEADTVLSLVRDVAAGLADPSKAESWHVPAVAFETLAALAPKEAGALAVNVASLHKAWQVRVAAVRVAIGLRLDPLARQLARDDDPNVRAAALEALSELRSPAFGALAIQALEPEGSYTPSHQSIRVAAELLRSTPEGSSAVPAIMRTLRRLNDAGNETSRGARLALLDRLAEFGTDNRELVSQLAPMLKESDPPIAVAAARTLTKLNGQRAVPAPDLTPRNGLPETDRPPCVHVALDRGPLIGLEMRPRDAPLTVSRFLTLVDSGFYDDTTFHRVFPNAYVQAGSPGASDEMGDEQLLRKESSPARHVRGAVGLAHLAPHAGNMQFFVDLVDAPYLDRAFTVFASVAPCRPITDPTVDVMLDALDTVTEGTRIQTIRRVILR